MSVPDSNGIGRKLSWRDSAGGNKPGQGKQARHILNHPDWLNSPAYLNGGGSYFENIENARRVFELYKNGGAEFVCKHKDGIIIKTDEAVGFYRSGGAAAPSNVYKIEGRTSVKIYPVNPTKYA